MSSIERIKDTRSRKKRKIFSELPEDSFSSDFEEPELKTFPNLIDDQEQFNDSSEPTEYIDQEEENDHFSHKTELPKYDSQEDYNNEENIDIDEDLSMNKKYESSNNSKRDTNFLDVSDDDEDFELTNVPEDIIDSDDEKDDEIYDKVRMMPMNPTEMQKLEKYTKEEIFIMESHKIEPKFNPSQIPRKYPVWTEYCAIAFFIIIVFGVLMTITCLAELLHGGGENFIFNSQTDLSSLENEVVERLSKVEEIQGELGDLIKILRDKKNNTIRKEVNMNHYLIKKSEEIEFFCLGLKIDIRILKRKKRYFQEDLEIYNNRWRKFFYSVIVTFFSTSLFIYFLNIHFNNGYKF